MIQKSLDTNNIPFFPLADFYQLLNTCILSVTGEWLEIVYFPKSPPSLVVVKCFLRPDWSEHLSYNNVKVSGRAQVRKRRRRRKQQKRQVSGGKVDNVNIYKIQTQFM